ncbi:Crp/Fnr family transcriptional regulator [Lichenibacterium ramalinae]|jgi:CRP-like cAMP-binding protein|uniref:Crp/Fnr family transcriptional regulator n=1 Tax=Lichenibacterium ramalinae TaxID=2316527 RepID=A0A4Q2R475_9HYPH|nr:Crp/Fnr family transcriptional regulator [Lichenibacterium ramalinae]RYB01345.1 Crp/Fnr family transcriptional regulator [Lichenibacterium ramalinae]
MDNVLTRKLEKFAPLSAEDRSLLDDIIRPTRTVPADTDLIREGQSSNEVRLILKGFACRYKMLPNGRRQIVAYLIPGDFCDLNAFILEAFDHSIGTLSECTVVDIPRQRIMELTDRPGIARAFWWVTLVDEGTLREWLLNIGQRGAAPRVAHLFCELLVRLRIVDLAHEDSYELPLTQAEIADTMGISPVHVNRVMQTLREMDLIEYRRKSLVIKDLDRLIAFSDFNGAYLHLQSGKPERQSIKTP